MSTISDIRQILSTRNVVGCDCSRCVAAARRHVKACDLCGYVGRLALAPCVCESGRCRPGTGCEEHGAELCAFCGGNGLDVDPWQIVASIRGVLGDEGLTGDPIDEEVDAETLRRIGYVE